jgi:hypothetical protein
MAYGRAQASTSVTQIDLEEEVFMLGAAATNSTAAALARNNLENVMKSQNEWKGSASECERRNGRLGEAIRKMDILY